MEGRHCVAGPWFTVHEIGGDWKTLEEIWISNGNETCKARVQVRVNLEESNHEG